MKRFRNMFHLTLKNCSIITTIMEKRIENMIWLLIGLVAIVAAVSIIVSILFGRMYGNGYFGYGMMTGYGFWIMPVMGAVALVFVVVFLYFLLSALPGSRPIEQHAFGTAETLARERFAKGEISEEEYDSILQKLRER